MEGVGDGGSWEDEGGRKEGGGRKRSRSLSARMGWAALSIFLLAVVAGLTAMGDGCEGARAGADA